MRSDRIVGVLFAAFVVIAAINAPPSSGTEIAIPFWGPFQRISDNNRWICTAVAVGLAAVCFSGGSRLMAGKWGLVTILLLVLHLFIFAKNCFSLGLSAFSFLLGLVILLMTVQLVARKMMARQGKVSASCWWPLVLASFGFLIANLIQYRIDPAASMQVSSRFHGVTSNPQMYALTTAIMIPALLFQYTYDRRKLSRLAVLLAFLLLLFFALRSGSRLSLLLSAFSVLMYYRAKVVQLAAFVIPAVLLAMLWLAQGEQLSGTTQSHLTSLEDTRSDVWQAQIKAIFDYPLFGKPLGSGERAGFAENSYLAAGANLGIPGFLLALGLGFVLLRQAWILMRLESRTGWKPELAFPIAVLSTCVLGGVFEAFLLGIFTLPLASMLYTSFVAEGLIKKQSIGVQAWRGSSSPFRWKGALPHATFKRPVSVSERIASRRFRPCWQRALSRESTKVLK